ncbi:hypothetical protein FNYG_10513 [Fusarium nygamai]|uniref:PD-(D/E)XK nuclease-like domain-containing protein n=1 Tax=Gibberella nygamai TaxID=42673 RepID=A0A2K0W1J0_GIBNY|nr:hypothetical protein FNYG_10513 [Fusarium nygamai]
MESILVQAWVNDVNSALTYDQNTISTSATSPEDMSSPTKRPRTSDHHDLRYDQEQTPTRARVHLARAEEDIEDVSNDPQDPFTTAPSDYSYPAVLGSSAGFSVPFGFPPPATITSRSRSASPTKKFRKTADLLTLMPPVRFNTVSDFEPYVPEDAHKLVRSLSAVEAKEGILPASLQNHTLLQSSKIRPYSWQPLKSSDEEDDVISLQRGLAHLQSVVDDSITSRNLFRSEAAWNCLVHTPLLKHTISEYDFLKVEPITSAGIARSFRPLQRNGRHIFSQTSASSASTVSEQDDVSSHSRTSAAALSVNKMVDFALVLEPKDELKTAIDEFLDAQPVGDNTITQTLYEPLRTRPACIFIETKIASGNIDAANCQLGVWVAAWHERMRSIIKMGDSQERVLTIPVIQVISSIWTILFVVDTGSDIVSLGVLNGVLLADETAARI